MPAGVARGPRGGKSGGGTGGGFGLGGDEFRLGFGGLGPDNRGTGPQVAELALDFRD